MPEGFVFELPSAVYPKFPETKKIKELKAIWESWTVDMQYAFTAKYGDIALLLLIEIDEQLLKAIVLFWDPSYRCFTFTKPEQSLLEKVKESPIQKEVGSDDEYGCKRFCPHDQVEGEE